MKKLSLTIAAAATVAALGAAPAFAESNAHIESQYKVAKLWNKQPTIVAPKVQTRATTFGQRAVPLTRSQTAIQRLFGNRPGPSGR